MLWRFKFFKGVNTIIENQNKTVLDVVNKLKGLSRLNLRLSAGLNILPALTVLAVISYILFFVYLNPNEYGIKVNQVGPDRGVQKVVYHIKKTPDRLLSVYRPSVN